MGRLRKEPVARKPGARGNPGIWFDRRKEILVSRRDKYINAPRKEKKLVVAETVEAYLDEYPFHFKSPPNVPEGASEDERTRIIDAAKDDARAEAGPQINTWLKNQVTKENAVTKNPFRAFLAQRLKVLSATKPAHVPEHKMWMKQPEYRKVFQPIFEKRWAEAGLSSEQELTQRVQIAQEVYDKQGEGVKAHVRTLVEEDYARRLALCESVSEGDEVTDESAEMCRENISALVEPLLEELCRLCKLNVGTIMLARPPQDESEGFKCLSVDVGKTIASEGSVKLPNFEPDKYCDLYLRWFLRFVVHTTEKSAALAREQEERERQAAQPQEVGTENEEGPPVKQVGGVPSDAAGDAGGARRRQRRRRRQGRRAGVDARELSGDETAESSMDEELDDDETGSEDEGNEEVPAVQAFEDARQGRVPARREKERIPVDEYGIPLHDVKGREFSSYLRERLSRMACEKRSSLLNEIDRMSDYELDRQDTISKNECTIRALLLKEGLLTAADPLWGDVVPQKIDAAPVPEGGGDATPARSASTPGPGHAAMGPHEHFPRPLTQSPVSSGIRLRASVPEADLQPPSQETYNGKGPIEHGGEQGSEGGRESAAGSGGLANVEQSTSDNHELNVPNPNEVDDLQEDNNGIDDLVENIIRPPHEEGSPGAQDEHEESASTPADARRDKQPKAPHAKLSKGKGARARGKKLPVPRAQDTEDSCAGGVARGGGGATVTTATSKARDGADKRGRGSYDERPKDIFLESRAGWLDWVSLGVDNLTLDNVAPDCEADKAWRRVVATWWMLEKHGEFKKDKRVPANGCRPKEIGEWIKRARFTTFAPQVPANTPPEDFLDDWTSSIWRWWSSLNPQWRERNTDGKVSKGSGDGGNWMCLHYPGLNGHLSVLKAVKWWFDLEGKPRGSRGWLELVEDVQWALDGVLKQLRDSEGEGQASKRRRTK